jgi:hypothetical protein
MRGATITWGDLAPALAEVNGAAALEDAVLDRMVALRLQETGIVLGAEDIDREREQLRATLADEAGLDADASEEMLENIRRDRGLGPRRFEALLRRNAGLRALARPEAAPSDDQIALETRLLTSQRVRARVMASASRTAIESARAEVLAGSPSFEVVSARFAQRAQQVSTDPTAPLGGLVEGMSADDPAVPQSVREAIRSLSPGAVSDVLQLPTGFGLVLVETRTPPAPAPARDAVEQRVRRRGERVIMQRLARELLRDAGVSVVDDSLAWSWDARR